MTTPHNDLVSVQKGMEIEEWCLWVGVQYNADFMASASSS